MTNGTTRLSEFFRRRGKSLPKAYSYQLGEDAGRFGLDVFGGSELRVDESRMAVFVPYADGNARDGVGDLLEVQGIDHTRHQRNPIVLYDHGKDVTLPVGSAEDPDTNEYSVEQDEHSRTEGGWCFYYQGKGLGGDERGSHALFCEQLFDLQCRKLVRGGSLGYTIIEASKLPADHRTGTPEGLHLIRTKMLEFSVVVLPCNEDTVGKAWDEQRANEWFRKGMQDATRRILCLPHVCGKRMSPYLVKSLAPWAPPRKSQMGYEGKSCKCDGTPGQCRCPNAVKAMLGTGTKAQSSGSYRVMVGDSGTWVEEASSNSFAECSNYARVVLKPQGYKKIKIVGPDGEFEVKQDAPSQGGRKKGLGEHSAKMLRKRATELCQQATQEFGIRVSVVEDGRELGSYKIQSTDRTKLPARVLGDWLKDQGVTVAGEGSSILLIKSLPGAEQKTRMAATANTTGYAPGDKVAARELLRAGNFGPSRYTFANPGDKLEVVASDPGGRILVRNPSGKTEYFSSAQLRKTKELEQEKSLAELRKHYGKAQGKPGHPISITHMGDIYSQSGRRGTSRKTGRPVMEYEDENGLRLWMDDRGEITESDKSFKGAQGKSLHALRKKYRPVGGVRRRLKKSTPGAAMVQVRHKDVAAMREEAEARGLKSHLVGEVPGGMKFKLMGDDENIDAVASLFGSRLS